MNNKRYPLGILAIYGNRPGMPAAGAVFLAPIVHIYVGTFLRKSRIEALKVCNRLWPLPRKERWHDTRRYWTDLYGTGEYTTGDEQDDIALVKQSRAWSGNKYIWDSDTEQFIPLTGEDVA